VDPSDDLVLVEHAFNSDGLAGTNYANGISRGFGYDESSALTDSWSSRWKSGPVCDELLASTGSATPTLWEAINCLDLPEDRSYVLRGACGSYGTVEWDGTPNLLGTQDCIDVVDQPLASSAHVGGLGWQLDFDFCRQLRLDMQSANYPWDWANDMTPDAAADAIIAYNQAGGGDPFEDVQHAWYACASQRLTERYVLANYRELGVTLDGSPYVPLANQQSNSAGNRAVGSGLLHYHGSGLVNTVNPPYDALPGRGEFSYDSLGNIVSAGLYPSCGSPDLWPSLWCHTPQDTFTYNPEHNRLLHAKGISYSYDEAGFVTQRGDAYFDWHPNGRIRTYLHLGMGGESFSWDSLGRPVRRDAFDENAELTTTRYLFGGQVEADTAGQPQVLDTKHVRLALDGSGEHTYRHFDFRGNVQFTTNHVGDVETRFTYSAYGLDPTKGTHGGVKSFANGEQLRSHPDLYILGARIHDAAAGRFLSPDPIFQIVNQYQYAHGNPVAYSDPSGLDPVKAFLVPPLVVATGTTILLYGALAIGAAPVSVPVAITAGIYIAAKGGFVIWVGSEMSIAQINSTFGTSIPSLLELPPLWGDQSLFDDSFPTSKVATEVWIPLPSTITMMGGSDGNTWCFTCNGGQCSSC